MTIFFDENVSPYLVAGLSLLQERLKFEDGLAIELKSIAEEFGRGTADEDWIPKVARQNGCGVTHDINIKRRRQQLALMERHGLSIIFVKRPSKRSTYWDTALQLVKAWPEVRRLIGVTVREGRRFQLEIRGNGKVREMK